MARSKKPSPAAEHIGQQQRIKSLIEQLNHTEPDVRVAAAQALVPIGQEAVPALIRAIKDNDRLTRRNAAITLGMIVQGTSEPPPGLITAVPGLMELLRDPEVDVRRAAAGALFYFKEAARDAVPGLMELLRDPEADVRREAAEALIQIGRGSAAEVSGRMEMLHHPDAVSRWEAVFELASLYENKQDSVLAAVPSLIDLLRDPEADVRGEAARTLVRIGKFPPAAVPVLIELLHDPAADIRSQAAGTLGYIGDLAQAAVPRLIDLLRDPEVKVRGEAVWALGRINHSSVAAVPVLIELLHAPELDIPSDAAKALGRIGKDAAAAVPVLIESLHRGGVDPEDATLALCRIDLAAAAAAVPVWIPILKDAKPWYALTAKKTLKTIGRAAVPLLVQALLEEDQVVGSVIKDILTELAQGDQGALSALTDAVPMLSAAAQDTAKPFDIRFRALAVLKAMKANAREALPALKTAYADAGTKRANPTAGTERENPRLIADFVFNVLDAFQAIDPDAYRQFEDTVREQRTEPFTRESTVENRQQIGHSDQEGAATSRNRVRGHLEPKPPEQKPQPQEGEQKPERPPGAAPRREWAKHLEAAVATIPADTPYDDLVPELDQLQHDFRQTLAAKLQPALNEKLRSLRPASYQKREDKQKLAKWTNAELRRFGLAPKAKTGKPSIFVVDKGNNDPEIGRFILQDPEGKRPASSPQLSALLPIELTVASPSKERPVEWRENPPAEWVEKIATSRGKVHTR